MPAASKPTIAVVDYGMGNLRSVEKALEHVGAQPVVTSDLRSIGAADALVLPGVGAFPAAMRRIRELSLERALAERVEAGVPLLGICLGMQLLFEGSAELGGASGLGLLPGEVRGLRAGGEKLPHIGWSAIAVEGESELLEGIEDGETFYFVHSFVADAAGADLLAAARHGERFAAIVGSGNVFGAQFHPEKSSLAGLRLLRNFVAVATPAAVPA